MEFIDPLGGHAQVGPEDDVQHARHGAVLADGGLYAVLPEVVAQIAGSVKEAEGVNVALRLDDEKVKLHFDD